MKLQPFKKPFKRQKPDLKRLREIVAVLAKYQFTNVLERTGIIKSILKFFKSTDVYEELDSTAPERLRMAMEDLGTTFIKLAQVLSTRPDLVGKDVADELSKLQDEVPPVSFELVKKMIESELEKPLDELFMEFEEEPIASASIAQVHRGVLKDGSKVAIKVQRPNITEDIEKDITIMRYLVGQVNRRISDLKYYNLTGIVDEFERAIEKELDFAQELRNIDRFRTFLKKKTKVYAPKTYPEYSSLRVLTMEYIKGTKIGDVIDSDVNYDRRKIAEIGTETYFRQIFIDGYFHADPHPGNILVMEDNVLCFVDFGMMGHLDQEFRDNLAELFVYTVRYDVKGMINQLLYMGIIDDETDTAELKYDLMDLLDKYYGAEIKDVGGMITEFSMPRLMVKHQLKLPKDFILLGRVLSMAEDLGRKLDPSFNGIEFAEPLIRKLFKKKLNPLRMLDYQTQYLFELEHIVKDLPQTINQTLLRAKKGKIKMDMEINNLDRFADKMERIVDRISIALIIAALIIGSSLILQTNKGMPMPVIGFSTVGIVVFMVATIMAIILIISILRKD
ncbi:MAG: AarF/ABC1/UbiB kinase family protein [Methanobacteriaceae archaeon]|nr:AarF/ABC1/UbiB kinase family protein [Methanobacteriaceae archaeon]